MTLRRIHTLVLMSFGCIWSKQYAFYALILRTDILHETRWTSWHWQWWFPRPGVQDHSSYKRHERNTSVHFGTSSELPLKNIRDNRTKFRIGPSSKIANIRLDADLVIALVLLQAASNQSTEFYAWSDEFRLCLKQTMSFLYIKSTTRWVSRNQVNKATDLRPRWIDLYCCHFTNQSTFEQKNSSA